MFYEIEYWIVKEQKKKKIMLLGWDVEVDVWNQ